MLERLGNRFFYFAPQTPGTHSVGLGLRAAGRGRPVGRLSCCAAKARPISDIRPLMRSRHMHMRLGAFCEGLTDPVKNDGQCHNRQTVKQPHGKILVGD